MYLECSERHPCEGLNKHAHFRDFGMAFLTLFRVATGDNWNGIMKVTFLMLSKICQFSLDWLAVVFRNVDFCVYRYDVTKHNCDWPVLRIILFY